MLHVYIAPLEISELRILSGRNSLPQLLFAGAREGRVRGSADSSKLCSRSQKLRMAGVKVMAMTPPSILH